MKEIPLTKGRVALVDDEYYYYIRQFNWFITKSGKGYAARKGEQYIDKDGKKKQSIIFMHRIIMNTPKNMEVDHRNRIKTDNRKSNMRNCIHSENTRNRPGLEDATSQYKGVYIYKSKYNRNGEYRIKYYIRAKIAIDGKQIHIGSFKTEEDAARAYNEAAKKYFGEYALLNEL